MRKKAIVLATACLMILVVVFFEFYVFRTEQTTITVQAGDDASISFGSSKWLFWYASPFGSNHATNPSFPFPYFPLNLGEGGKPILIVAWTNATSLSDSPFYEVGTLLSATKGASLSLCGLEMTVASANPFNVTLVFERLS